MTTSPAQILDITKLLGEAQQVFAALPQNIQTALLAQNKAAELIDCATYELFQSGTGNKTITSEIFAAVKGILAYQIGTAALSEGNNVSQRPITSLLSNKEQIDMVARYAAAQTLTAFSQGQLAPDIMTTLRYKGFDITDADATVIIEFFRHGAKTASQSIALGLSAHFQP